MTWLRCSGWGLSSALQEGPALLNILRSWMGWGLRAKAVEQKQRSRRPEKGRRDNDDDDNDSGD